MITHYDLFAGIGGFSLALEEVFTDDSIKHIFCEWERFPTAVLKRHWPDGEFWGDIAELVADTGRSTGNEGRPEKIRPQGLQPQQSNSGRGSGFTIVTGGFPCQPFSHAGRRQGTADDRYQWPNMFAVIRNVKPKWVIAENVRGLVTWNDGMVLETVCTDLESEGYEVQPFIIPAVAVGAPHRRDRVWIIAHRDGEPVERRTGPGSIHAADAGTPGTDEGERETRSGEAGVGSEHELDRDSGGIIDGDASHAVSERDRGSAPYQRGKQWAQLDSEERERDTPWREGEGRVEQSRDYPDWSRDWREAAFATCDDAVDDGLSRLVDGVPYSRAKWRKDSLKAYGNGIVWQVAEQIVRGIKKAEDETRAI